LEETNAKLVTILLGASERRKNGKQTWKSGLREITNVTAELPKTIESLSVNVRTFLLTRDVKEPTESR
jgi:hypothetical protein